MYITVCTYTHTHIYIYTCMYIHNRYILFDRHLRTHTQTHIHTGVVYSMNISAKCQSHRCYWLSWTEYQAAAGPCGSRESGVARVPRQSSGAGPVFRTFDIIQLPTVHHGSPLRLSVSVVSWLLKKLICVCIYIYIHILKQ